MNTLAVMNPGPGEVLTATDNVLEIPAHEFAHAKGIADESDAQIAGVIAHITSGNQSLEYIGYKTWLGYLMDMSGYKRASYREHSPILCERGLNERTVQEIETESEMVVRERFGGRFSRAFQDMKLFALGQGDMQTAYADKPLALLADYRRKQTPLR